MDIVLDAVNRAGGVMEVSSKMNVSVTSVHNWIKDNNIPFNRLLEFERVTGVLRSDLAPELFSGYRKSQSTDKQFIPDLNDAVFLIASYLIEKANDAKSNLENVDNYKSAMISLCDLAKVSGMSEIVTSSLFVFSQILGCPDTIISPVNFDLLLERGCIDPVVINKMFMPDS